MEKRIRKRIILIAAISILAVTSIAYLNSFRGSFQFDDNHMIVENRNIISPENFADPESWASIHARPLSQLSFAIDYAIWGLNQTGFHLTNLLIHLLNGVLLLLFLLEVFKNRLEEKAALLFSLAGMGIFLLNPLQTESVTYIVQRMTSLSALFGLGAVYLYLKTRMRHTEKGFRKNHLFLFCLVVFLLVLSVLSKQTGLTMAGVILVTEILLIPKTGANKTLFLSIIGVLILTSLAILLISGDLLTRDSEEISRFEYSLTQMKVIPFYLGLVLFPIWQNADHDISITESMWSLPGLLGLGGLILWLFLLFFSWKKRPLMAYGMLFFSITMAMESTLFPIRDVMAEHRMYLPLAGILITVGGIRKEYSFTHIKLLTIAGVIYLSILSVLTHLRNRVWESPMTLWEDSCKKSPGKARTNLNYGLALLDAGKTEEAIPFLTKSTEIKPDNPDALNNLGIAYYRTGKTEDALTCFHKALSYDPHYKHALNNTGMVWLDAGEPKVAFYYFYQAAVFNKGFALAYFNAGLASEKAGSPHIAVKCYSLALAENKNYYDAMYNLANVYMNEGKSYEAEEWFLSIPEWDKNYANALNNLAGLKLIQGKKEEAIELYKKVLSSDPNHPEALNNLRLLSTIQNF